MARTLSRAKLSHLNHCILIRVAVRCEVAKVGNSAAVGKSTRPPKWIKPQLTRLVDEAPAGKDWLHEIKYDS